GAGSPFTLGLPLAEAELVVVGKAEPGPDETDRRKIMLVGGARLAQNIIAGLIRPSGAEVLLAADAAAALGDTAFAGVDLLVVDAMTVPAPDLDLLVARRDPMR